MIGGLPSCIDVQTPPFEGCWLAAADQWDSIFVVADFEASLGCLIPWGLLYIANIYAFVGIAASSFSTMPSFLPFFDCWGWSENKKIMSNDVKEDPTPKWHPSWQLKCIFAVVGLLNFVAALDATSISVSLPVNSPKYAIINLSDSKHPP